MMILTFLALAVAAAPPPTVTLRPGMVITKSITAKKQIYRFPASASLDSAVIVIRGSNIVVDLNGATLLGNSGDPDQAAGIAIRVDSGNHVTIKNGTIHGYRFNLLARGTTDLTLKDLDLGRSWKPRLYSLVEHESIADWLSFHHNEKNEWLRYGAGAYLDGVHGGTIRGVTAEQGMNGLLLAHSDSLLIHDNTFAFNSGLGIGLYRSSWNRILHNELDYNVRGYSNGFYWRGQDSADLLFFEQSSNNVVAYNSATHGGDGLFLWAGQSTMDTGDGGANDNLFYGNDFSFAPANAMEATFSRNTFVANRAEGSDYGLWGGYSYSSAIAGNCFSRDRIGAAIEHGQDNIFTNNRFDRNELGLRLWGDSITPGDWGYPKHRDTKSRDARVEWNYFSRTRVAVNLANTSRVALLDNGLESVDTLLIATDTSAVRIFGNITSAALSAASDDPCSWMLPLPERYAQLAPKDSGIATTIPHTPLSRRDRSAMIVDEWGPYDWRTPKIWPIDSTRAVPLRLAVLGPAGRWRLVAKRGIDSISATSGAMNDTISITPQNDWQLTLESNGARFSYSSFEPKVTWHESVFAWSDSTDPRTKPDAFVALFTTAPLMTMDQPRLDYVWYRPKVTGIPLENWALVATTTVELGAGTYTLRTISDDGVRVWIDGALVIDDWMPHESAVNVAPLSSGKHDLRVEYYQVDGWTELRVDIVRGAQRAGGSPGPH
jgi:parallel beta-helix repeat protein